MAIVSLKKTTIISVNARKVTGLTATLDDGNVVNIPETITANVGDVYTVDQDGGIAVLTDADFQAE